MHFIPWAGCLCCRAAVGQQLWGWHQPHWTGPILLRLLRSMRGHPAPLQHSVRIYAAARQVNHHRTQPSRSSKYGLIPLAEQAPQVAFLSQHAPFSLHKLVICTSSVP